jgi:hypothetical protein
VLFTGFTAGPSVRTTVHEGQVSLSPEPIRLGALAKRALAAFAGGAFMGVGIAAVFGRIKLWSADEVDAGGRPAWLEGDEPLVRHGPANRFRGPWALGGWLFLTDRRLVFRPHRLMQRAKPEAWPLDSIAAAEPCRTLWLVPNGLRVRLRGGDVVRFAVSFGDARTAWVDDLQRD